VTVQEAQEMSKGSHIDRITVSEVFFIHCLSSLELFVSIFAPKESSIMTATKTVPVGSISHLT
jgi:hypothetical protein